MNDRDDTAIGGAEERFPATRHSILAAASSDDPGARRRGFAALVEGYWKPVYKYLRLRHRVPGEDAKDLTQGFFAKAFEKGFFDRFDPSRASFRTFLRTCLEGFASNERKAASRLKRGGDVEMRSLDFEGAEGEIARGGADPSGDGEALFRREWVRSLFERAVDALRERCAAAGKDVHFEIFSRYDLDGPDAPDGRPRYADIAEDLGLTETQVTNHLASARREFRGLVLEKLREGAGSETEFREDARSIFGPGDPSR